MLRLGVTALVLAWCFDQLFWQKAPGVSFFIFVLLCLGAGVALTWGEKLRPAAPGLLLLVPILFFAWMSFSRQEPFTLLVDYGLTLGCMLVLSLTWLGGDWWRYNVTNYIFNTLRWIADILIRPFEIIAPGNKKPFGGAETEGQAGSPAPDESTRKRGRLRVLLAVFLGLLMALPVVILLASLLAQADPIFERQLQDLFKLIDLKKLDEYMFRLFYIAIGTHLLSGVFLHALLSSRDEKVSAGEKAWLSPFLGWIEAITLLASVDLLFGFFVAVQFRYFFGGRANIRFEGFTYSEYARRGFGELVAVAVISLLLLLALSAITRRQGGRSRIAFSALGIALVLLVAVILVSAFQRLLLYEAAYGFTRLRAYTHVFMVWLGLLLLATAFLDAADRMGYFALATVLAGLCFGVTLNLLNVDGFIARQNVLRTARGSVLDSAYLASLSGDAAQALFEEFDTDAHPQWVHDEIGAALACRLAIMRDEDESLPWPSFNWSRQQAMWLYQAHQDQLEAYPMRRLANGWNVKINGVERSCWN
jgi:hypothetical protein